MFLEVIFNLLKLKDFRNVVGYVFYNYIRVFGNKNSPNCSKSRSFDGKTNKPTKKAGHQ
jgi:hypothetical protein